MCEQSNVYLKLKKTKSKAPKKKTTTKYKSTSILVNIHVDS